MLRPEYVLFLLLLLWLGWRLVPAQTLLPLTNVEYEINEFEQLLFLYRLSEGCSDGIEVIRLQTQCDIEVVLFDYVIVLVNSILIGKLRHHLFQHPLELGCSAYFDPKGLVLISEIELPLEIKRAAKYAIEVAFRRQVFWNWVSDIVRSLDIMRQERYPFG